MGNLKRLAQATGLSTSTISRVLSGANGVSLVKREKVWLAAKQLGLLKTPENKERLIIAVSDGYNDPFHQEIIEGINSACMPLNYSLVEFNLNGNDFREHMISSLATAIIFIGERTCNSNLEGITVPLILIGDARTNIEYPGFKVDNLHAAFIATQYLTDNGHTRIGQILGNRHSGLVTLRNIGYRNALLRTNARLNLAWNFYGDFSFSAGEKAMDYFLSLPERPTAVFSHGDRMAIGAMKRARERGLRIPDDISFIGFQDIELSGLMRLTSVSQDLKKIGGDALIAVHEKLEHGTDIIRRVYQSVIVERDTVRRLCASAGNSGG